MIRRLLLVLVVFCLALPSAASAQLEDPLGPLAPPTPQPTPAPEESSNDDEDGLDGWQEALIFVGGGILLVGIAWAILADAKRRAPTSDEELHGPKHDAHHQQRKQKARKKAKVAKASRKRNRPR